MSDQFKDRVLDVLRLDRLRPHERTKEDRIEEVRSRIESEKRVDYPILVDDRYNVILDGHHRYRALSQLGVTRAPVVKVEYTEDGLVKLEARTNCPVEDLTKQDVLRKGLSSEVFPPKSTRHTLRDPLTAENVSLEDLK